MINFIKNVLVGINNWYFSTIKIIVINTSGILVTAIIANIFGALWVPIILALLMAVFGLFMYFSPKMLITGAVLGGAYAGIPGVGATAQQDVKQGVVLVQKFIKLYFSTMVIVLLTLGAFYMPGSLINKIVVIVLFIGATISFIVWSIHNPNNDPKVFWRLAKILGFWFVIVALMRVFPSVPRALGLHQSAYTSHTHLAEETWKQKQLDEKTRILREEAILRDFTKVQKKFYGNLTSDEIIAQRKKLFNDNKITKEELKVIERERERRISSQSTMTRVIGDHLPLTGWETILQRKWYGDGQRVYLGRAEKDYIYRISAKGYTWRNSPNGLWSKITSSGKLLEIKDNHNTRYQPAGPYWDVAKSEQVPGCEQYLLYVHYGAGIVHVDTDVIFIGDKKTIIPTMGGEEIYYGNNLYSCAKYHKNKYAGDVTITLERRRK